MPISAANNRANAWIANNNGNVDNNNTYNSQNVAPFANLTGSKEWRIFYTKS